MIFNYFDKVYCINLERDSDRWNYILNQFANSKLLNSLSRFIAVDGRSIKIEEIDSSIITNYARECIKSGDQKIFGISLTYGSLGCALSHKIILEECQNSTNPFLVFEDDIILINNFDNYLIELINSLKKLEAFDIVYLGFHNIPGSQKTRVDSVLSKPTGFTCGTYGLIISPQGAKKILNTIFPLNQQIDSSISNNLSKFNAYCCTQNIVQMNNKFQSNTQKKFSCNNIYNNIKNWNKLFQ